MTRFAPILLLIALIAVGALVLLRGGHPEHISAGALNRPAPSFALTQLGAPGLITSDQFAGRPHLINLFASWCAPCRAEHAQLLALKQRGVAILGVAYKNRPEDATAFLRELGNPFDAVALDGDGRYGLELGTSGIPETYVISADGRIVAVHRGPLTSEIIDREILPALSAAR